MVECQSGALYTGITPDIARRMEEHASRGEKCAKYTRGNPVVALRALWKTEDKRAALRLEYAIKRLCRADKLRLVADPGLLTKELCVHLAHLSCQAQEV